jgi:hypothetical protein
VDAKAKDCQDEQAKVADGFRPSLYESTETDSALVGHFFGMNCIDRAEAGCYECQ